MSTSSQSRDQILNTFQEISGLNIEDCICFLNQYNWKLDEIVNDFYKRKDFKANISNKPKETNECQRSPPIPEPNLGSFYGNTDRKHQAVEDDDRYIAQLLAQYGDADESARRHWRDNQQPQQQYYHQIQPQTPSHENTTNTTGKIYHEKQKYLRCGIHSLNNLFQTPNLFTPEHLDNIVRKFDKSSMNNDYGKFWVGDYDLRILIEAINEHGYQVRQINYFKGEPLQNLPWDSYFGLLINLNGAHWFTIKNLNGLYYNLDSTFSKPSQIGRKDALANYLIHLIQRFQSLYIFAVLAPTTNHTYH